MKQTAAPNTAHSVETAYVIVVQRGAHLTLAEAGGGERDEGDRRRQGGPFETPFAELRDDRQGAPSHRRCPRLWHRQAAATAWAEGRDLHPPGDGSIGELEQFVALASRPPRREGLRGEHVVDVRLTDPPPEDRRFLGEDLGFVDPPIEQRQRQRDG